VRAAALTVGGILYGNPTRAQEARRVQSDVLAKAESVHAHEPEEVRRESIRVLLEREGGATIPQLICVSGWPESRVITEALRMDAMERIEAGRTVLFIVGDVF